MSGLRYALREVALRAPTVKTAVMKTAAGKTAAGKAGAGLAGGVGTAAGLALLLPMEAGVPIPVPADLVMLAVGARVGAGDIPLPLAVLGFEAVAVLGTTALFLAARGPGFALVRRLGPRIGLSAGRLARATAMIERRGRPALAAGRATPGLRTLTVIAAGGSGLSPGGALPALIAGSSIFLQLHLFLGYFLGSAALHVLHAAAGPALAVLAAIVVAGLVFWFTRRRRRLAAGFAEASCPACLTVAYLAGQAPGLAELLQDQPGPGAAEVAGPVPAQTPAPGAEPPR